VAPFYLTDRGAVDDLALSTLFALYPQLYCGLSFSRRIGYVKG
jgi:hypothetical protein